jgi:uncharacterized circularly permuted ATP-grasp superfamily protein/uncharacterized alpha-E superfamily protein
LPFGAPAWPFACAVSDLVTARESGTTSAMSISRQAAAPPDQDPTLNYQAGTSGFDELRDGSGALRPHWHTFRNAFAALDPFERAQRMERLNHRVRETGIAHDLFADPNTTTPPWRIDLVPLIIPPAAWQELERALLQRARLFEAILADVYGPQQLLRSGAIPPQLVFNDPSYLRPCHGLRPRSGYLQFFAADLARDADGSWRVIDTHTETPAGLGYALANRMVHTHVAGDLFGACHALRLASFFQAIQGGLAERANRSEAQIALLTPGPHHNDFFSHAYLARYLGLLLVEGGDLRIRGERAYLKTLEGLRPLDLIVRCVAGASADPLELDPTGFLGPVGLMQAVRRRPDVVVNALGSALAENRGLGRYLPDLCRDLLGDDLHVADARRWWLGDESARRHVLDNLDGMVIRPAHEGTARPGRAMPGRDPVRLDAAAREALLRDIALHGAALVAEEKIGFATTPSFDESGLVPTSYAVRFFVAATRDGFVAMPGGLAMTVDPDASVSLSASASQSRDVWVLADGVVPPHLSLWRPTIEAARVRRSPRSLPSRVADNLFWLGRYTERADWTMRVLRCALARIEEDSAPRQDFRAARKALEVFLAKDGDTHAWTYQPTDASLIAALVRTLLTEPDRSYGLQRTLDNIHRIAGLTRDRLSHDTWRVLNSFHTSQRWRPEAIPASTGEAIDLLDRGSGVLAAFNGLVHENMTRNVGWAFLDMGRRLARANRLSEVILAVFAEVENGDDDAASMLFVLELADCFITYRSRYRLTPMLPLVLDLLLVDETNPRSLAFQLASLFASLDSLPQTVKGAALSEEQRMITRLLTEVRLADVRALAGHDAYGKRRQLAHLLGNQLEVLPQLSDAITRRYFNLTELEPHWVRARWGQEL